MLNHLDKKKVKQVGGEKSIFLLHIGSKEDKLFVSYYPLLYHES